MHILNIYVYIILLPLREQINWLLYRSAGRGSDWMARFIFHRSIPLGRSPIFHLRLLRRSSLSSVYKQCLSLSLSLSLSVCVCMHECARSTRSRAHPRASCAYTFPLRFFHFRSLLSTCACVQTMGVRRWIVLWIDKIVRVEHALSVALEPENGRCFWKTEWLKREFVELWSSSFLFFFFFALFSF